MDFKTKIKMSVVAPKERVKRKEQIVEKRGLILFNDDVNSFDHVIDCLMNICEHEMVQAEQCAWVVHTNGKCLVKTGTLDEVQTMCLKLVNQGLSAKVD
jgi:ATP-dependent Clp protease adaptor protein ClpS